MEETAGTFTTRLEQEDMHGTCKGHARNKRRTGFRACLAVMGVDH